VSTLEERQGMKRAMPKTVLEDKHVRECRIVPTREALLDLMPKHGVVAEIGAAFGDFTAEIFERTAPSRLHLIDAWSSKRYRDGLEQIKEKFSAEIEAEKLVVNQGLSTDQLETFDDHYFDWVYIDTDHSYQTTRDELELAVRKVKSDGRIAGDDFTAGNPITPWPYGVIEAAHEFCAKHGWTYELLSFEPSGHFSFSLKKL